MLCPVQPERKKCTFQDALKHRRGRRDREGGGFLSLFLGLRLGVATPAFGTSPSVQHRDWHEPKASPVGPQPRGCTTPLGQSSFGECLVPLLPHLIPSRASWEVGNGKDLSVGRQECPSQSCHPLPHSALLEGDIPSPGVALRERRDSWGYFLFWMFGFARRGAALEESQIHCTPSKNVTGSRDSLVHPWLPGGFSVLFLLFFFFSSLEKEGKIKTKPQF